LLPGATVNAFVYFTDLAAVAHFLRQIRLGNDAQAAPLKSTTRTLFTCRLRMSWITQPIFSLGEQVTRLRVII